MIPDEKKIEQKTPVLDENGYITAGYATSAVCDYRRKDIKAPFYRIKEWDFYQVSDGEKCLQFTIGHASYAGQVGVMLFDFKKGEMIANINKMLVLPFNRLHLPENGETDHEINYHSGGYHMHLKTEGNFRYLSFSANDFSASITLERKNPNSLVINIPFDEYKTAFYYNQKINCMTACGHASVGGKAYTFDSSDSFGLLDWGRGVWPFHNEWYWSNGTGIADGEIFGFNLGTGFGNTSAATENMLFYKGEAHKIGKVSFELDKTAYMMPWRIHDEKGLLDLTLTPMYDRTTRTKVLFIDNVCHQMFGVFSGEVTLSDGTVLHIKDITAFAEHAVNNW